MVRFQVLVALMMEAANIFEILACFYQTTRRNYAEDLLNETKLPLPRDQPNAGSQTKPLT
jgi:hypothetical protein